MNKRRFLLFFLGIFGLSFGSVACILAGHFFDIPAFNVLAGSFASLAGSLNAEYFANKRSNALLKCEVTGDV